MEINIMKVAEIIYFNLEKVFFSLASYMGIENMKVAGIKTTEMWSCGELHLNNWSGKTLDALHLQRFFLFFFIILIPKSNKEIYRIQKLPLGETTQNLINNIISKNLRDEQKTYQDRVGHVV